VICLVESAHSAHSALGLRHIELFVNQIGGVI